MDTKYKHEKKTNGSNGKASTNKPNGNNESTGQPQAAAAPASCDNCGMKNHTTSECRKLKMSQGNANVVCFQCNQVGHKKNACPMNRSAGPQRAAALQQIGAEVPIEQPSSPHQCGEAHGGGEVELACGCMMAVAAGARSPDEQVKQWKTRMKSCTVGKVNNTQTMVLRDTGSTTCVVKTSLVKPEHMTGSYELCMLIDGVVKAYPTAVVNLDTPYFQRKDQSTLYGDDTSSRYNHRQYTRSMWYGCRKL